MKPIVQTLVATLLALVAAVLPQSAAATTIATDSFDYTPIGYTNSLPGQSGGTGWGLAWNTNTLNHNGEVYDTTASPLTFAPAGGAIINGGTRAIRVTRWTAGASALQILSARKTASTLNSTFYAAYLMRSDNIIFGDVPGNPNEGLALYFSGTATDTANSLNFGIRLTNTFVGRFGTGAPNGTSSVGITGSTAPGDTHYLVMRLNWDGAKYSSMDFWLDPGYTSLGTPSGTCVTTTLNITAINYVFFRVTDFTVTPQDVATVDEVKLGTTWDDVVAAGTAYNTVRVETAANGTGTVVPAQNLTATNSITMYAVARTVGGVFVTNTPAGWSLVNLTGNVVSGDLVPAPDGKSAVFTGHLAGSANIHPSANATTLVDSGTITVQAGPASIVRVETASDGSGTAVPAQAVPPSSSITVYSIVRDVGGNFLSNAVAAWSLQNKTSGIVNGDLVAAGDNKSATFTGALSGTANIRATSGVLTAVDSGLITVSRSVTWVGGGANNWNFVTANWTTGSPVTFLDIDDVTFDGSGSQSPAVNVTTTVKPNSVNITGGTYTFSGSGSIAGTGSLTLNSGTTLLLLNTNSYTGSTVVANGTIQLGNGSQNGSFGLGDVRINTGGTSLVFNRTDAVSAPYLVSNTISGVADFIIDVKSGAVELAGGGANARCNALVESGGVLLLGKNTLGGGAALGNSTSLGTTVLNVNAGGKCMLASDVGDHITAAGKYLQIDGTFDANGHAEAFGVIQGAGVLDNTGVANAILTVNQGSSAFGGIGNAGETFNWNGVIQNTGSGTLGITKDGTNTLILVNANSYGGDTRIVNGGVLQLGDVNSMQNSALDYRTADSGRLSFGSLTSATLGGLKNNKDLTLTNESGAFVALTLNVTQTNSYSGGLAGSTTVAKTGAGSQTLSGTNTYAGATTISGGTLLINGALTASPVTVGASGTLGGNGTIGSTVGVSGTLRPGNNNIGRLTVNNTVTLSGTTGMEISRTTTTNADQLAATTINLGGTLIVTNIGGTLQSGNTFTLFSGALNGSITAGSLPPLWPGLSWNTSALNSAGTIAVTGAAIPPLISSVSGAGGNLTLSGSGGLAGATYYVVSTNNLTAPRANWPRIATNTFAANGGFTNAFTINPAAGQNFFSILAP